MEGIGFALARILSERSLRHGSADFDTVRESIVEQAGIDYERAEALLWGEPVRLDSEESEKLADAFALDRDLLACLLRPTSREILLHVLRSMQGDLDPSCEDCAFLLASLGEADGMSRGELLQVCVDFLDHLSPYQDSALPPAEEQLLEVFRGLSPDAQSRVMAYAWSERAASVAPPLQVLTERLGRLRSEFLRPESRALLDEIARSGQELAPAEIEERTGLSLSAAEADLRSAMGKMKSLGIPVPMNPLLVSEDAVALRDEALGVWSALLRSDNLLADDNLLGG